MNFDAAPQQTLLHYQRVTLIDFYLSVPSTHVNLVWFLASAGSPNSSDRVTASKTVRSKRSTAVRTHLSTSYAFVSRA
jgi:hypothetical protein